MLKLEIGKKTKQTQIVWKEDTVVLFSSYYTISPTPPAKKEGKAINYPVIRPGNNAQNNAKRNSRFLALRRKPPLLAEEDNTNEKNFADEVLRAVIRAPTGKKHKKGTGKSTELSSAWGEVEKQLRTFKCKPPGSTQIHPRSQYFLPLSLSLSSCTLLKTAQRRRISSSAAFKSKTLKPLMTHVCVCVCVCTGPCLETSDSYRVCARHSSFDTSQGKSDVSHDHKHRRNVSASFQDGTWLAKPEGREKYYVCGEATRS